MQRFLVIAGSLLVLTACSSMADIIKPSPHANLAKIAKQHDAQHALLLTRSGELVVVNVATGELVQPSEGRKAAAMEKEKSSGPSAATTSQTKPVSDEEFAEIQRKIDSTITLKAIKGSVCMNIAKQPPGKQWIICSPPYPQWW
ncbi:MAG: hypothetical protein AABZ84_10090 [Pseudomonadota bacterium]